MGKNIIVYVVSLLINLSKKRLFIVVIIIDNMRKKTSIIYRLTNKEKGRRTINSFKGFIQDRLLPGNSSSCFTPLCMSPSTYRHEIYTRGYNSLAFAICIGFLELLFSASLWIWTHRSAKIIHVYDNPVKHFAIDDSQYGWI